MNQHIFNHIYGLPNGIRLGGPPKGKITINYTQNCSSGSDVEGATGWVV